MFDKKGKKKGEKKPKIIVSIDNYTKKSYTLKGNNLSVQKKVTLKNNNVFITYLANKDMIIAPIEIGAGIMEEDLDGAIENMAYDELGLDATVEYMIHHKEIEHGGDGRHFQLFIIEKDMYVEIFSELQKQIKYIDYIVPAPILFKSLYQTEKLQRKGVQCFLFFSENDTFVTFYKNGDYLYSKSIKYSFQQIYDKYCEMIGETVDETMFFKTLANEGMRATQADYQQNIMRLFGEIFVSINDILVYAKRAYELDNIDQMYIGSTLGPIIGLEDYTQNYLGLSSSPLEFEFDFKQDGTQIDQLQYLMMTAAQSNIIDGEELLNFTIYPRPPVFFKRTSGQFISATLIGTALALMPPTYFYIKSLVGDAKNALLQQKETELNIETNKYKKILAKKKEIISKLDTSIKTKRKIFSSKEKTLTSVYNKKVFYKLKSEQLKYFSDDLAKFNVKTVVMQSEKDTYYISLLSTEDEKITQLIAYISNKYAKEIKSIDIKRIEKNNNNTFYKGVLKVVMK